MSDFESRSLDQYNLIGSPGYMIPGLEALDVFSGEDANRGDVPGVKVAGTPLHASTVILCPKDRSDSHSKLTVAAAPTATENLLLIGRNCLLHGDIQLLGSEGTIILNGGAVHGGYIHAVLWSKHQLLFVGEGTSTNGNMFILGGPDRAIIVGADCMFATRITVRTSDLHSAFDMNTGVRLNSNADIILEPHIWLGDDVVVGKGVCLGYGSIVGAKTFLNKSFPRFGVVAGTPGRLVRREASWVRHGEPNLELAQALRAHAATLPLAPGVPEA